VLLWSFEEPGANVGFADSRLLLSSKELRASVVGLLWCTIKHQYEVARGLVDHDI
jgi:hypothetical protein